MISGKLRRDVTRQHTIRQEHQKVVEAYPCHKGAFTFSVLSMMVNAAQGVVNAFRYVPLFLHHLNLLAQQAAKQLATEFFVFTFYHDCRRIWPRQIPGHTTTANHLKLLSTYTDAVWPSERTQDGGKGDLVATTWMATIKLLMKYRSVMNHVEDLEVRSVMTSS